MKAQVSALIRKLQNTRSILIMLLAAGILFNIIAFFYFFQPQRTETRTLEAQFAQLQTEYVRLGQLPDGKRITPEKAASLLEQVPPQLDVSSILVPLSNAEHLSGVSIERIQANPLEHAAVSDTIIEKHQAAIELSGTYEQIISFVELIHSFVPITEIGSLSLQTLSTNDNGTGQMVANLSLITYHAPTYAEYLRSLFHEKRDGAAADAK